MTDVLDTRVLKLNSQYAPLDTVSVREALVDLCAGIVEAIFINEAGAFQSLNFTSWRQLSEYKVTNEADWINTPRYRFPVPRIVRCVDYSKVPIFEPRLTPLGIMERDNYTCQYCGHKFKSKDLNIDHVIPRSRGGKRSWTNLVCSCFVCNNDKKQDRTPAEAGMKLIRKPIKPVRSTSFLLPRGAKVYHGWDNFVSLVYWSQNLSED